VVVGIAIAGISNVRLRLTEAKKVCHSWVSVNTKRTDFRMPQFEPDGGKNKDPATLEDYETVREGKGTPEQIAKVRDALQNKYSPLYLELGESATWARWMVERKYATPIPASEDFSSPAHRNLHVVIDYLRSKREAGVLSEQEVNAIVASTRAEHLEKATPSSYAMCVTRMTRAITKLHPELASEVKNLPISRNR
jgi:hypothetical protein